MSMRLSTSLVRSLGRAWMGLEGQSLSQSSLRRTLTASAARRSEEKSKETEGAKAEETAKPEVSSDELTAALEDLQARNTELEERAAEFKDKYLRELASVDNMQKRMQREVAAAKDFAIQGFAKDLLEVPDILQRALEAVPQEELGASKALADLNQGLGMTTSVLMKVFSRHGLDKIAPEVGEKFDPDRHEALCQIPDPAATPGTVGQLMKVGYSLKDRTIRAAQVGVYKAT